MAKKAETIFKEKVLKDLKAFPLTWAVKVQQIAIRGTPDILACIRGYFVALELKSSDRGMVTKLQEYVLTEITGAKGIACVATPTNWPAIRERLNRIAKGDPALWAHE